MDPDTFRLLITVFQFVYAITCFFGVAGNSLVMLVIATTKQLHTTSNIFIFSMAAGDLLFLVICTPLNVYQLATHDCWKLGAAACSASFYLMNVSVLVSCFSLCLLSVDRCLALRYPLMSIPYRQPANAILAICVSWLVALLFPLYKLVSSWMQPNQCHCKDNWDRDTQFFLYLGIVMVSYIIPLAVISICFYAIYYSLKTRAALPSNRNSRQQQEEQRRILVMTASMVVLFAIIWGPVHVGIFVIKYELMVDPDHEIPSWQMVYTLISRGLIILGGTVNPFVYAFMGQNFRTHLIQSLLSSKKFLLQCVDVERKNAISRLPPKPSVTPSYHKGSSVVRSSRGGDSFQTVDQQISMDVASEF